MRVHSTKSLLFRGDNGNEKIKYNEIKDLPDWVAETDTFKFAKAEGSLMIIKTKEEQINAENEGEPQKNSRKKDTKTSNEQQPDNTNDK